MTGLLHVALMFHILFQCYRKGHMACLSLKMLGYENLHVRGFSLAKVDFQEW
jgi:hypothetical protein